MDTVQPKLPAARRQRSGPHSLHKASVRDGLEPRREPYWGDPIRKGQHVGLRKISAQNASWIARYRPETGTQDYQFQKYKSLGLVRQDFGYDQAKVEAEKWFKEMAAGALPSDVVTVEDACRAYLKELRSAEREQAARDAERRFERTVYGRKVDKARGMAPDKKEISPDAIAKVRLDKLSVIQLKEWRNNLPLSLSASNRTLTALKAALNLAVENNDALAPQGGRWAKVVPHEIKEDTRRKLFLDLKQRRALVAAAQGPVRDLIEAASLTGARAGELTSARVKQFHPSERELTLTGKTGTRTIKLLTPAVALLKRLSRRKGRDAYLLTREGGRPWAHSDWDELVKDAAKAAKLPPETCLYTLRHSWISQMIADGMTTVDVKELCGTSLAMIEKHYGKVSKDIEKRLNQVKML